MSTERGTGLGIWIDTSQWHSPATLKARNVDGVIRYLCMPYNTGPGTALPNKRLERAELDQKIGAGIGETPTALSHDVIASLGAALSNG